MTPDTLKILTLLNSYRFVFSNEIELQNQIEKVFTEHNIDAKREYRLSRHDIVDFFVDGIAIEIKTEIKNTAVYRQCERYCMHEQVKEIILATTKTMNLPEKINDKPAFTINLSNASLL